MPPAPPVLVSFMSPVTFNVLPKLIMPPLPPLPPDPNEKDPAKIKAMVEKRLAAEGKTGNVNVQVVEKDGHKEVKVTVEAEAKEAGFLRH